MLQNQEGVSLLLEEGVQQLKQAKVGGANVQILMIYSPDETFVFVTESEDASFEVLAAFVAERWKGRFDEPMPDDVDIAFEAFFDDEDGAPSDTYDYAMYGTNVIRQKSQAAPKGVTVEAISSMIKN
jgi:hypothetical protein